MKIVGSLEVFTPQNASTDRGQIKFTGEFGADYGKLKAVGYGGFGNLMLDCANLQSGLVIRTAANQDSGIAGQPAPFAPYSLKVVASNGLAGSGCVTPSIFVDSSDSTFGNTTGNVIMQVKRGNTSQVFPSTKMQTSIVALTQNTWKPGESITMNIGFSATSGNGVIGYYSPTGSSSDVNNRLFLGMYNSSTSEAYKALMITTEDNVEIPKTLTSGSIYATTYLNLPPVPASDLLPITLDKVNSNVGINNTNPQFDLDVDGAINSQVIQTKDIIINASGPGEGLYVGGDVEFSSLAKVVQPYVLSYDNTTGKVEYMDPPTADLLPITLDKTNNRVGINNTSPQTDLDVSGSAAISGELDVVGAVRCLGVEALLGYYSEVYTGQLTCDTLLLPVLVQATTPQILYRNDVTGTVSYGPAPVSDLAPLTLDKVNNRVGINNTSPQHALDVVGGVNIPKANAYKIAGLNGLSMASVDYSTVCVGPTRTISSTSQTGVSVGKDSCCGNNAVSIGSNAGAITQGQSCVAVGSAAGASSQGTSAVAVGYASGNSGQGTSAVAIGTNAGKTSQGNSGIAIGNGAGNASQGANTIAIGQFAGITNQHTSSIILNATGSQLNSANTSSFYVKPVRQVIDASMPRLSYNATTGEIMYGNSTTDSLLPITLDKTNNHVGIRTTTPATDLDVNGTTSTNFLMLQSIPKVSHPDVLMYDPTTKAVSYGPVSSYAFVPLANDVNISANSDTVLFSVPLSAGLYSFTHSVSYIANGGIQFITWLDVNGQRESQIGTVTGHTTSTAPVKLTQARTVKLYAYSANASTTVYGSNQTFKSSCSYIKLS
jgi:hypothetical protein